jgi:hypothetical protein
MYISDARRMWQTIVASTQRRWLRFWQRWESQQTNWVHRHANPIRYYTFLLLTGFPFFSLIPLPPLYLFLSQQRVGFYYGAAVILPLMLVASNINGNVPE